MTRLFASRLSVTLRDFAMSSRYPTRTVEHAFACVMFMWGYSVAFHTGMVSRGPGNAFGPMLDIMPACCWGWFSMTISAVRLAALIANGHWHPTPELRLVGAAWGMLFWVALSYCYWEAVNLGAADFPMRRALLVLIFFEAYACFRCGQDIGERARKDLTGDRRSSVGAEYG
jgi:hypothetical protein